MAKEKSSKKEMKEKSIEFTEEKGGKVDEDTVVEIESENESKNDEQKKGEEPEYTPSTVLSKQIQEDKPKKDEAKHSTSKLANDKSRKLILYRHAEQMDKIFPDWIHQSFLDGKYVPVDMNQPSQLPIRKTPLAAYDSDPPLTEMGLQISQMIGKALAKDSGIEIKAIYSSPSLRCIQTAQSFIKAQSRPDLKINVEPSFYDFAGKKDLPIFMSTKELLDNGIPVDKDYQPITSLAQLSGFASETAAEFFKRQSNNIYNLTKQNPHGSILIITHPCTIHAIGRELIGKTPHSMNASKMLRVPFNYPYCSGIAFKSASDGGWCVASQILPTLTFSNFSNRFNYHFFVKH